MVHSARYAVAVIGGGVAGSEAAYQLAQSGILVVLLEQNILPYGKIEEGLPKWHIQLRHQEERKIDHKLDNDLIHFIPGIRFGTDFSLPILWQWGFSAVLLAFGAWKDRRLPIPGIDQFIGKGLCYQNVLVSWFNHSHDPDYKGPVCDIRDDALIIGGGLASLDVAKIVMLETTCRALLEKGYACDLFSLEKAGIPATLKKYGLSLTDLGLKGCTVYYRKRKADMPLTPPPHLMDPEGVRKIEALRLRILQNYCQKYLFNVRDCLVPAGIITEAGRLNGIVFHRNKFENGQWRLDTEFREPVTSPLIISSIGSVPEAYRDIPMEGDLLAIEDHRTGRLKGLENVFALGNAVTGRGNIRESLTHSRGVTKELMAHYLQQEKERITELLVAQEKQTRRTVHQIQRDVLSRSPLPPEKVQDILKKVHELQIQRGYRGNYREWVREKQPPRLEDVR